MNCLKAKNFYCQLFLIILFVSCSSQKKLAYLNNLTPGDNVETFSMSIPDYKIQTRDILYITIKAMAPDGTIADYLSTNRGTGIATYSQGEAGQYLYGFNVDIRGEITLPVLGIINVSGLTLDEAKNAIQEAADRHFNNATVECKLISFKYTVLGEVRAPGTFLNYNNFLTVFEAVGRAGGIDDYGRRDKILVLRSFPGGTKTFTLNLQDKNLLSSEAYFLMPNDVIIVEPQGKKIFNLNIPTFTFIISALTSAITTTLLLINYFGK